MNKERKYMQVEVRTGNLVSKENYLKSDAALRKQRSKNRSLFPFTRVGRQVYYPADLVVATLSKNVVGAKLR